MSTELIELAKAGDQDAFRELVEPYRRELHVHCYRILASVQDAEDALQETLLAAWRGLGAFERRASVRTWLYSVATSRALNMLRAAKRERRWSFRCRTCRSPSRRDSLSPSGSSHTPTS